AVDILTDGGAEPSALTEALALLRKLEREAAADGGGRFEAVAAPEVAQAAAAGLAVLRGRLGGRLEIQSEPGRARSAGEVGRR
ncbi:MAG: ribonuclease E/G, partial [Caulobacteraceae bacterium]